MQSIINDDVVGLEKTESSAVNDATDLDVSKITSPINGNNVIAEEGESLAIKGISDVTVEDGFFIKEGDVYHNTRDKRGIIHSKILGRSFRISNVIKMADMGSYYVEVEYVDAFEKRIQSFVLDAYVSAATFVKEFAKHGVIFKAPSEMYQYFQYYLGRVLMLKSARNVIGSIFNNNEAYEDIGALPGYILQHEVTGWFEYEGELAFAGEKIFRQGKEPVSDYIGKLSIIPEGEEDKFIELICSVVSDEDENHVELEVAMAIAVFATLLGFFNYIFGTDILNPIFHMYGLSSSGKTTTAQLIAAFGGKPSRGRDASIFLSFNSTMNALMKKLSVNRGYPICIDELSLNTQKDLSTLLYSLADGEEKDRLTRSGAGIQHASKFESAIVTTGEGQIKSFTNGNSGLDARVIQLSVDHWTRNSEQADRIKAVVNKNYGFMTARVARYLLDVLKDSKEEELYVSYIKWVKKFVEEAKEEGVFTGITERLSKTLGLLMVALEVLDKIVEDVSFHINSVYKFLFSQVFDNYLEQGDHADRAYDFFKDFYAKHQDGLYTINCNNPSNTWGALIANKTPKVIDGRSCSYSVALTKSQAEEIFVKSGVVTDVTVLMKEFLNKGVLVVKDGSGRTDAPKFVYCGQLINGGYRILVPDLVWSTSDSDFPEEQLP